MTVRNVSEKNETALCNIRMSPKLENSVKEMADVLIKVYELGMRDGAELYRNILNGTVEEAKS